jgi:hypothetical protein
MSRLQFIPEILMTGNGIQRLRDIMYRLEDFISFKVQYNIITTEHLVCVGVTLRAHPLKRRCNINVGRYEVTSHVVQYTTRPTEAAEDAVVGNQPIPAEDKIGLVEYCDID